MIYTNLIRAAMVYPKALYSDLCFSHCTPLLSVLLFSLFQAEDGIRVHCVTGVQTCALPIYGVGVMGVSTPPGGVGAGDGVQGITNSPDRNGIYGRNDATTDNSDDNDAVGNGVLGFSNVPHGCGVRGMSGNTVGHGVFGTGGFGTVGKGSIIGVWGIGEGRNKAWAGY